MPEVTSITLTDKDLAAVVFTPIDVSPEHSLFTNAGTIAAGDREIVLGWSPKSTKRPTDRINARFNYPVEVTSSDTGRVSVEDVMRFSASFVVPEGVTSDEREDFAKLCGELLTHAILQGYIKDRDPCY